MRSAARRVSVMNFFGLVASETRKGYLTVGLVSEAAAARLLPGELFIDLRRPAIRRKRAVPRRTRRRGRRPGSRLGSRLGSDRAVLIADVRAVFVFRWSKPACRAARRDPALRAVRSLAYDRACCMAERPLTCQTSCTRSSWYFAVTPEPPPPFGTKATVASA